ncbi:glycoside hydrolase [Algibacter miyuki]|uniref:Glycoside hydrolase n=1 Tax=Algibacter miyuki TaxID=1306933 RepID=A0ABV5H057_9FLAO|nr:glycoside hydrolase [Algibacter miyuki]MDN3667555.1 glycoside hydrolase [Algibacter miyuki]
MKHLYAQIKPLTMFWCIFAFFILKGLESKSQTANANTVLKIELNTNKTFQTIQNFGASDAWSTQFVGKYWPEDKKEDIAKLLFSKLNKQDGSPEGIGLTAWRFNIGAGSAEQGDNSEIKDEWRRAESFLLENRRYDWDKQAGQIWFLNAAKKHGVKTFIGFVNSPPVHLTKNGKAWSADGLSSNLGNTNYKDYANFLVEIVKGVSNKTDITFNYISPFNEPQWEWKCCNQEGSPWNNSELYSATIEIDKAFIKNKISSKIELTEAGEINALYTESKNANRGNQIESFFNKNSSSYVGALKSMAQKIAGHSYFSTYNLDNSIKSRTLLNQKRSSANPDLEYWMTEYCILENNEIIKGNGRDLGIDAALYMARVIHLDLVIANASAWHWWLAVSPYNYKDGLIYIDKNKFGGEYYESKMLWALGNYSRFISPKMKRIEVSRLDELYEKENIKGILESAFISENEIVVVLVNQLENSKNIALSGLPKEFDTMEVYLTSGDAGFNLKKTKSINPKDNFVLPKRSITTCVIKKHIKIN